MDRKALAHEAWMLSQQLTPNSLINQSNIYRAGERLKELAAELEKPCVCPKGDQ